MTKIIEIEKYCSEIDWDIELQHDYINLVIAPTGSGKALKHGTGVLTPIGYKPIESLKIGEPIFGNDGKVYNVSGVFPQGKREVYNVIFSDGSIVPSSDDHLWEIQTAYMRPSNTWKTISLREIIDIVPLTIPDGQYQRKNIYVPMPKPFEFSYQEVPIPPYSLGVLLGDGHLGGKRTSVSFTNSDKEIIKRVKREMPEYEFKEGGKRGKATTYAIISDKCEDRKTESILKRKIRELGLEGALSSAKFIPDIYKYNSIEVRLAILQGLIDTDGHCPGSNYEFTSVSRQLAEDVKFLCESLGLTAQLNSKNTSYTHKGEKKQGQTAYRLYIKTSDTIPKIHYSEEKGKRWRRGQTVARKYIKSIHKTGEYAEMTCISTTNPSRLFITEGCTVTHNSFAFLDMVNQGLNVAVVAPYVSITNQMKSSFPEMDLQTGTKASAEESFVDGRITSFHSIPKMLELANIDILVIDEWHVLSNYAGFTTGMLTTFWNTVEELKLRHKHMRIVALTGTPQFMIMADFLNYNIISVRPKEILSKPKHLFVSRSWTRELAKNNNYLYLIPSKWIGQQQSNKYKGIYIDASTKETSLAYQEILQGRMPGKRIFTSTVLSTGISITDPIDFVYTNWIDLVDIIQMSARARQGNHTLKVTQTIPWFLRNGMDKPALNWTGSFEKNMGLLNRYQTWYSYIAHGASEDVLFALLYQMLWKPEDVLPDAAYL